MSAQVGIANSLPRLLVTQSPEPASGPSPSSLEPKPFPLRHTLDKSSVVDYCRKDGRYARGDLDNLRCWPAGSRTRVDRRKLYPRPSARVGAGGGSPVASVVGVGTAVTSAPCSFAPSGVRVYRRPGVRVPLGYAMWWPGSVVLPSPVGTDVTLAGIALARAFARIQSTEVRNGTGSCPGGHRGTRMVSR